MTRVCWIGCLGVLLLAGLARPAAAQSTADAYFHEAARQYVADDLAAARRTVARGLEVAPSDPRLLALRKKLNQDGRPGGRQNQQDGSSSGSEEGSRQNENQSPESSSKDGQEPSPAQSGSPQERPQEAPPSQQDGSRSSDAGSSERSGETAPGSSSGGSAPDRAARADTMGRGRAAPLSRAQAERLLRALEGQERRLMRQLRTRSSPQQTVEKDW